MPPPTGALSAAQLDAVTHAGGPLLVLAGAGTGKTRVVTERFAWLVSEGTPPECILALTFSNPAAAEMLRFIGPYAERGGSSGHVT